MKTDRLARYVEKALEEEVRRTLSAPEGTRNNDLFRAAFALGQLVGAGMLSEETVWDQLGHAALSIGLREHEARSTIKSGLTNGKLKPRNMPEADEESPVVKRIPKPSLKQLSDKIHKKPNFPRPPAEQVKRLWNTASPVTEDKDVSHYLKNRAIDPQKVALFDLARAIPLNFLVPRWAFTKKTPWSLHHRIITRGWGASGALESLHACSITNKQHLPTGIKKGLWPAAGPGSATSIVMADSLAQALLNDDPPDWWTRKEIVITEGLPDFLTWATNYNENELDVPAIFGITSGGWTKEIAARVPNEYRVVLATDLDEAGERYAKKIYQSLDNRCEVRRWNPR